MELIEVEIFLKNHVVMNGRKTIGRFYGEGSAVTPIASMRVRKSCHELKVPKNDTRLLKISGVPPRRRNAESELKSKPGYGRVISSSLLDDVTPWKVLNPLVDMLSIFIKEKYIYVLEENFIYEFLALSAINIEHPNLSQIFIILWRQFPTWDIMQKIERLF